MVLQERGFVDADGCLPIDQGHGRKLLLACKDTCKTLEGLSREFDYQQPDTYSCCLRRLLYVQPDFIENASSGPTIQSIIKEAGHLCIFLPKFHPEFNYIETNWSRVKVKLRSIHDHGMSRRTSALIN